MSDLPVPKAEAKPSKSDLVAQEVTRHRSGCDCYACWGIRTGFDIGYASGMSSGVAAGRAQAAADIRERRVEHNVRYLHVGRWKVVDGITSDEPLDVADLVATGWPSDGIHQVSRTVTEYVDGSRLVGAWLQPAMDAE